MSTGDEDILQVAQLLFGASEVRPVVKGEHKVLLAALKDRMDGKMTSSELTDLCYKWALEYTMDEYAIEPLPGEPVPVQEWKYMDKKMRSKLEEPLTKFYEDEKRGYENHCDRIKARNRNRITQLKLMERHFEGDLEKRDRVRAKLRDLRAAFALQSS